MNKQTASGGMGFCSVLTLIFIVLKLLNVITWSWWWVLSPIWIPTLLIGVILLTIVIIVKIKYNK